METIERNIEEILKGLKSLDFEIRRSAISDLVANPIEDKLNILTDLLQVESDIQLKYQIRKSINEIESLQDGQPYAPAKEDPQLSNLRKAFQSADPEIVDRAFNLAANNRLVAFLPEMMMIENYSRESNQRCCIIRLMVTQHQQYFRQILGYLEDSEPRVISTAIEALESIGNTTALASISRFTGHPHNRVRASAIQALHSLGGEEAYALFLKMIQSPYSAYRDSAAYSLSQVEVLHSVQLLSILLIDEVESVRIKALRGIEALCKKGSTAATDVLQRLKDENPYGLWPDKLIEKMITDKELITGKPISIDPKTQPTSRDLAALYSDERELRLSAIQKLSEDEQLVENASLIIERLKLEKDYKIIASAILALGKARGDSKAVQNVLQRYLQHHNDRVRANAIESLVLVTSPPERVFLVPCLKDVSNRVVANAVVGLWDIFKKKSQKALDDMLASSHKLCHLSAVYCIGELADWKLGFACEVLLKSKHPEVVEKMEETLQHLNDIPSFARILQKHQK
jgi:HEAT repeat protein